ncbi:S8 family serine peptidase [bacterium]|nr:S8 family serine peptidase [bacterium]
MVGFRLVLIGLVCLACTAPAGAWIHDDNSNRIDDRIESVDRLGMAEAYEKGDVQARRRIAVFDENVSKGGAIEYGVYVGYDRAPSPSDRETLRDIGFTGLKRYRFIDYVRARGTAAQIREAAALPGVARVEAIPMMYPTNHYGSRAVRARDSRGLNASQAYSLFPSAREELGLDGTGVVVAVLDTGVNDEVDSVNPLYPGHESLYGKFLGGGEFYFGDPLLNTPPASSVNPQDHGSAASSYHATHVAGSAIGTGGPSGFFAGVAPAARLVDCKVLSDAGLGFGSADGVEWCILNKDRMWDGLSGADTVYAGIDVLNLSLGGLDPSDGTDAGSQMINAAMAAGLVACVATGNDDSTSYITSPAAADDCISVGAVEHFLTLVHSDDLVTSFSNEGPRDDDGDLDPLDEMKPTIVAPGANIMSANGDPTTEGSSYQLLSGTSMSTPHAAGVAALLVQANPSLTPLEIRDILKNTATHDVGSTKGDRPNDPYGVDPNYDPGCGWGEADVYAAAKEALNSTSGVQVVLIGASARPDDGAIDFAWTTQREFPFQGFHVHRAPDVGGAPGGFTQLTTTPIAGTGSPVIEGVPNRTAYAYEDTDPSLVPGNRYWYRVDWIDGSSTPHPEPPVPVNFGSLPAVATVSFSMFHNTPDHDLSASVGVSHGHDETSPLYSVVGFSEAAADSAVVLEPANDATAINGYIEWFHHYDFTATDGISGYLPPGPNWCWFLRIDEGGYINRQGRVTSLEVFVPDVPGGSTGTTYVTDAVLPEATIETQTTVVWVPEAALDTPSIAPVRQGTELRFAGANPFSERLGIRFTIAGDATGPARLTIHDVNGRLVRRLWEGSARNGDFVADWSGRDEQGRRVAPGAYFVRLVAGDDMRSAKAVLVR